MPLISRGTGPQGRGCHTDMRVGSQPGAEGDGEEAVRGYGRSQTSPCPLTAGAVFPVCSMGPGASLSFLSEWKERREGVRKRGKER